MAYTKTVWTEQEGTYLDRFTKSEETANSVRLVYNPVVEVVGTPITPAALNNIETGIFTGNTVYPLTGTVSSDTTYTISVYPQMMTVIIPKAYLVASSGGPYTLTLTTGVSGKETVIVPIASVYYSITSNSLRFGVYIDSEGNVTSDDFSISAYSTGDLGCSLFFSGARVGLAYTTRASGYTKTKNKCTFYLFYLLSSKGSSVGNATIESLPFNVKNNTGLYIPCTVAVSNVTLLSQLMPYADPNTAKISLITAAGVYVKDSDFTDTSTVNLNITYPTEY